MKNEQNAVGNKKRDDFVVSDFESQSVTMSWVIWPTKCTRPSMTSVRFDYQTSGLPEAVRMSEGLGTRLESPYSNVISL
jgi:hypothetical protein